MTVFSNLSLKKKLVAAFVAVASITCVVAAIAWWNLAALRGKLSDVANTHLPGVRSLGEIRLSAETFKMVRRAMRDPNLDLNDYRLMLDRIAKAQESYEGAMKTFAALEMTPEKAALWNEFQATWDRLAQVERRSTSTWPAISPRSSNLAYRPKCPIPATT